MAGFAELFSIPVARAVYPCGCEVHYTAGGYSPRPCHAHATPIGNFPRIRKVAFLEAGARAGEYVLWRPVAITPARRATDK